MDEQEIRSFWNANPCPPDQSGGKLEGDSDAKFEEFFTKFDAFRYEQCPSIQDSLDRIDLKNKKVLEIGLGQGADSEQLIRRGAQWSGIDITDEAVHRVARRLEIRGLPYDRIVRGSALEMEYADNTFDTVYSYGVLHHIPEIKRAQEEIHRVLKPGGQLVVMLYARNSLNYYLSITLIRRLGLLAMYPFGVKGDSKLAGHIKNAQKVGLFEYLRMENFIHRNTDGPENPYAKVYDEKEVEKDFPLFSIEKSYKRFMWAPPLPVTKLPFERQMGWHLWVHMTPK